VRINVGSQGRGVVNMSVERRIGRVVGESAKLHTHLDALMSSSKLDSQVLAPLADFL
jgi:hypothetical protein